jgi:hypothetical protein
MVHQIGKLAEKEQANKNSGWCRTSKRFDFKIRSQETEVDACWQHSQWRSGNEDARRFFSG